MKTIEQMAVDAHWFCVKNKEGETVFWLATPQELEAFAALVTAEKAAEIARLNERVKEMEDCIRTYLKAGVGNSTDFTIQFQAVDKARALLAGGE